jgi:hypothetical protein
VALAGVEQVKLPSLDAAALRETEDFAGRANAPYSGD